MKPLIALLLQLLLPSTSSAWLYQSETGGGHVSSLTYDANSHQLLLAGTLTQHGFWNITQPKFSSSSSSDMSTSEAFAVKISTDDATVNGELHTIRKASVPELQVCTQVIDFDEHDNIGRGLLIGYQDHLSDQGVQEDGIWTKFAGVSYFSGFLQFPTTQVNLLTQQDDAHPLAKAVYPNIAVPVGGDSEDVILGVHESDQVAAITRRIRNPEHSLLSILRLEQIMAAGAPAWKPLIQRVDGTTGKVKWEMNARVEEHDRQATLDALAVVKSQNMVLFGGTTNGKAAHFGAGKASQSFDGYVTKLNMGTGGYDMTATGVEATHSMKITSQVTAHDTVKALCVQDDDAHPKVYVVGHTTGRMAGTQDGGAYVAKYDVNTLQRSWVVQIPSANITATHCTLDDDAIYIGGHVPAMQRVDGSTAHPHVKLDVRQQSMYVASFGLTDGAQNWIRQFGSHRRDTLKGLVYSSHTGDLVVTGNSVEFHATRKNDSHQDVFVMSMSRLDGSHDPLVHRQVYHNKSSNNSDKDNSQTLVIVFAVVLPILMGLILILCDWRRRRLSEHEKEAVSSIHTSPQKSSPISQDDLTGGMHGSPLPKFTIDGENDQDDDGSSPKEIV